MALLRQDLANLSAVLASEATNLQVAIRRAESVDGSALPVKRRHLPLQSHAHHGTVYMRSLVVQSAVGDSRRSRSASGEMPGCVSAA